MVPRLAAVRWLFSDKLTVLILPVLTCQTVIIQGL